jgi:CBS domain-containing protein
MANSEYHDETEPSTKASKLRGPLDHVRPLRPASRLAHESHRTRRSRRWRQRRVADRRRRGRLTGIFTERDLLRRVAVPGLTRRPGWARS